MTWFAAAILKVSLTCDVTR